MGSLRIEPGGDDRTLLCDWCLKAYKSVRGFVYEDDNAHAVYFAALHDCRPERIAHLAVVIGNWDENGEATKLLSVGVRAEQREDRIELDIVEPTESPWRGARHLGVMLSREAALENSWRGEFMKIVECVIREDAAVSKYLES